MTATEPVDPASFRVADLTPNLSCFVLECTHDDPATAFRGLVAFLTDALMDLTRARTTREIRVTGQALLTAPDDEADGLGTLGDLGFDGLFAITREKRSQPSWAGTGIEVTDVTNELTLAIRRRKFVALRTSVTHAVLRTWTTRPAATFRLVPLEVLSGTFPGDAKAAWFGGTHPRRSTRPDARMVAGIRVQDTTNTVDDSTSVLQAARVSHQPDDPSAVLRGGLVTNSRSKVSWAAQPDLRTFLDATAEMLDQVERVIESGSPPTPLFDDLLMPTDDFGAVRGAFDASITADDSAADTDDDPAELLDEHLVEVCGDATTTTCTLRFAQGDLVVHPVRLSDGDVELVVRPGGRARSPVVATVAEALDNGADLTIYYESGHTIRGHRLYRQRLDTPPFPRFRFEDFTGYRTNQEKPPGRTYQEIHNGIGLPGDTSLFGWVAARFGTGWLTCDDGPDEVADFLHLDDAGTLTVLHVKAGKATPRRRVSTKRFEEVVGQGVKTLRLLDNKTLGERLSRPRIAEPATWRDGRRVTGRDGLLTALRARDPRGATEVVVVQPHLSEQVVESARTGRPTQESRRMALLDLLLHGMRKSVTGHGFELTVIGAR